MNETVREPTGGAREPYLSIVVTSRNDNHGENMMHRFRHFMAVVGQLDRFQLPAELIIVEWNPPEGPRLHEVLERQPSRFVTVRFLEVCPQLHASIPNPFGIPLFQMIAKNVGIRRARGRFILSTCNDLIFSDALIHFLARQILEADCLYRCDRHDLSIRLIPETLDHQATQDYCRRHTTHISGVDDCHEPSVPALANSMNLDNTAISKHLSQGQPARPHTNACGDFTLMAREAWFAMGAYPEIGIGDIYVDGLVVYAAHAMGLRQICLPPPMAAYHIFHSLNAADKQSAKIRHATRPSLHHEEEYLSWCMAMINEGRVINPNGPHWGQVASGKTPVSSS